MINEIFIIANAIFWLFIANCIYIKTDKFNLQFIGTMSLVGLGMVFSMWIFTLLGVIK